MQTLLLTPHSVTLVLAYLHHYTCKFFPGRCLSSTHLNHLANWLQTDKAGLRTAREHRPLATHLSLLLAAGLLDIDGGYWLCLPPAFTWLQSPHPTQIAILQRALPPHTDWESAWQRLSLSVTPLDLTAYLQQTLERQYSSLPSINLATWLKSSSVEEWLLHLPDNLPTWHLFHLLQLGHWTPHTPLRCTPLTLAKAALHGYSSHLVQNSIEQATGQSFTAEQTRQLMEWYSRQGSYQIRPVYLLSTKQAGQLSNIATSRRLRAHFHTQISPRHAIVSPHLIAPLTRWLGQQGFPLDAPTPPDESSTTETSHPAYTWLGIRLLIGLTNLIPLPFPPPYSTLQAAEAQLNDYQIAELETQAQTILESIRAAIRGRDVFFPPENPIPPQLITLVQEAIEHEYSLDITYQALGDHEPRYRRIEPLRLEQQGELYYLYAYCHRTEVNLTFRLDRIHRYDKVKR